MSRPSNKTVRPSFIDDFLAGRAQPEDIDEYIDRWHNAPSDAPEVAFLLHEFLGMSWDEYRQWSGEPDSLQAVLRARSARSHEMGALGEQPSTGLRKVVPANQGYRIVLRFKKWQDAIDFVDKAVYTWVR